MALCLLVPLRCWVAGLAEVAVDSFRDEDWLDGRKAEDDTSGQPARNRAGYYLFCEGRSILQGRWASSRFRNGCWRLPNLLARDTS